MAAQPQLIRPSNRAARNMRRLIEIWPAHDTYLKRSGAPGVIVFEPLNAGTGRAGWIRRSVNGVKNRSNIIVTIGGVDYDTGTRRLGAILGDEVQTGCNSVLNPGCFVGPRTMVYPNVVLAKGFYPGDSVIKLRQQ